MTSNEWNPKDVAKLVAYHKWAAQVMQHEGEHADDNPNYDWAEAEEYEPDDDAVTRLRQNIASGYTELSDEVQS